MATAHQRANASRANGISVTRARGVGIAGLSGPVADGRLLIGATVEEQGFNTHLTAGGLRQLLNDATAVLPDIEELNIIDTWVGLRPGYRDEGPPRYR